MTHTHRAANGRVVVFVVGSAARRGVGADDRRSSLRGLKSGEKKVGRAHLKRDLSMVNISLGPGSCDG